MKRLLLVAIAFAALAAAPSRNLDPTKGYGARLQMFHLMKQKHPYPQGWSDHRDGIAIQAKWQDATGRDVPDASGRLDCWWSNVNYTLTVWPFLVLQKHRGDFPGVPVVTFPGSRFAIPDSFTKAVLAYYDELDAVRDLSNAGLIPSWLRPWHEWQLQQRLWEWHHLAVTIGFQRNAFLLPALGPGERKFAESWATMVGILKAVNFPTTHDSVGLFNDLALPHVWVSESDYDLTKPSALTLPQRLMLKAMWAIHKWSGPLLKILKWIASSPALAKKAVYYLKKALAEGWSGPGLWWKLSSL